jgi:hypothetical protein
MARRDRNGLRPRSLNAKNLPWDPEDKLSAPWSIQKSPDGQGRRPATDTLPNCAYDYGIKENILRLLRQKGFEVTVVPAGTSAQEVLALDPDGIFLSTVPATRGARLRTQNRARLWARNQSSGFVLVIKFSDSPLADRHSN